MIKNDDLLALPRAAKPAKAMRAAQEHARPAGEPGNVPRQTPREYAGPCTAPGVICAKVHETADGPVLALDVPFPVSWTVKMKKKQKETQDILSYHTQAAGCSDKARAKASGGRQPIEECGRTGL